MEEVIVVRDWKKSIGMRKSDNRDHPARRRGRYSEIITCIELLLLSFGNLLPFSSAPGIAQEVRGKAFAMT
jgi:hypothetical protein